MSAQENIARTRSTSHFVFSGGLTKIVKRPGITYRTLVDEDRKSKESGHPG